MAMNRPARFEGPRKASLKKPTNVSLSAALVEEAKTLGINVSEACQTGLAAEVRKAREATWKEENRAAIESWNDHIRENGMPYDQYRQLCMARYAVYPGAPGRGLLQIGSASCRDSRSQYV